MAKETRTQWRLRVAIVAAVAALPIAAGEPPGETVPPAAQEAMKQAIRPFLRDPESAQYSSFSLGALADGPKAAKVGARTACVLVNSKNAFGGYAGREPFGGVLMETTPKEWSFVVKYNPGWTGADNVWKSCVKRGASLSMSSP